MEMLQTPLTNLQLELLKVFARPVSEQDLLEIRQMLARFFAEKAMNLVDEVWEMNNWTAEDTERLLQEHRRKPVPSERISGYPNL
ncbi:MAG: hypothetical protein LH606_18830 [Cytophagaceae bacterium]|nr:hypothetical protein [Cytophagaceae bacterium]